MQTRVKEIIAELKNDKWISVKDRLPEEGNYLTCINGNEYQVSNYWVHADEGVIWTNDTQFDPVNVVAWMPIPECKMWEEE